MPGVGDGADVFRVGVEEADRRDVDAGPEWPLGGRG